MTSLKDVAERAGVSVATASRVATGAANVRPETRRRWGPLEWPALLRLADRKYPGFRD